MLDLLAQEGRSENNRTVTSTGPTGSASAGRRPRRSTEEVRARLLEAARDLFLVHGYEATYTKDIAAKAGVAEKVLYGNFASKAGIFDAAFTEPFAQLTDRYIAEWRDDDPATTTEQRIGGFVTGLFELAHRNRAILRSVLARRTTNGRDAGPDIIHHVARAIHSLRRIDQAQLPGVDQDAALIAVAGMVFGVVLLDDMLTPPGRRRPSRQRLQAEMTNLILHGVLRDQPTLSDVAINNQHHADVASPQVADQQSR
jgi:AcrR family transcriptional regulator